MSTVAALPQSRISPRRKSRLGEAADRARTLCRKRVFRLVKVELDTGAETKIGRASRVREQAMRSARRYCSLLEGDLRRGGSIEMRVVEEFFEASGPRYETVARFRRLHSVSATGGLLVYEVEPDGTIKRGVGNLYPRKATKLKLLKLLERVLEADALPDDLAEEIEDALQAAKAGKRK